MSTNRSRIKIGIPNGMNSPMFIISYEKDAYILDLFVSLCIIPRIHAIGVRSTDMKTNAVKKTNIRKEYYIFMIISFRGFSCGIFLFMNTIIGEKIIYKKFS